MQRAVLLAMLAFLMLAHLGMIYVDISECDAFKRDLFRGSLALSVEQTADVQRECAKIEQIFSDIADKYLAVILALLVGGAVVAAQKGNP
jgi:hypothetical protein